MTKAEERKLILESDLRVKEAVIDTLNDQIERLALFRPKVQVSIWKKHRAKVKKEIKQLKIRLELLEK